MVQWLLVLFFMIDMFFSLSQTNNSLSGGVGGALCRHVSSDQGFRVNCDI